MALNAGQKLLVRVQHKEGGGDDHLTVGWSRDGGPIEVIPGSVCSAPPVDAPIPAPTFLDAWHVSGELVRLAWQAPEYFYVARYELYRNGELLADNRVSPQVVAASFPAVVD